MKVLKSNCYILGLLCIVLLSLPTESHAQFWKKGRKQENAKKKESKKVPVASKKEEPKVKKKVLPEFSETVVKDKYRVDVLVPLYLNSLVKNGKPVYKKTPDYALPSINFFEGLSIAAQALNAQKIKLDLHIHDITDQHKSVKDLIAGKALLESDLIIGFVHSNDLVLAANFASEKKINFVSALSPSDAGLTNSPHFILMQPTLKTHIEHLISEAGKKYSKQPKYILHTNKTSGEKDAYKQFKEALIGEKNLHIIDCAQFTITTDTLRKIFDSTKTNVIYASILDIPTAEGMLNHLSALGSNYKFEIYGMPSWKSLRGLNVDGSFANLSIHYTTPFEYDTSTSSGKYVAAEYASKYVGSPSEMVFRGYETLVWFSNLLHKYGTVFNAKMDDVSASPFTRYQIEASWNKDNDFLYWENRNLYMLHYKNGNYKVE